MVRQNNKDYSLGILSHILGLLLSFIGPLIIFLMIKDKKSKDYENAKHSLNFQISLIIYCLICFVLIFILIGFLLLIALAVLEIVACIIGAIRASEGKVYTYPLEIKFLK